MPGEREPVSRDADILAIEEALDDLDYLCFGLGEEDGSLVKARAALSRVEERLAELERVADAARAFVATTSVFRQQRACRVEFEALASE